MPDQELPKLSNYRWVILAVVALMDMTSNYVQFQVSALATTIMPDLQISTAQFSSLLMAPMLIAVFLSIPGGSLGDKFGPKKVVTVGLVISILGAFGRMFAQNFTSMMVMLLLFGVYMALLNANVIKILGTWFKQDTNIAMGIFFSSASVGITLSQLTNSFFPSVKAAYIFSSCVLLVLAICWVLLVKDMPAGEPIPQPEPTTKYLGVAAKSKKTWLVAFCGGIGTAATMSFTGILPQALINAKGLPAPTAGAIASVATIGSLLGALIGPAIVRKVRHAKPIMLTMVLISALSMFIVWFLPVGGILVADLILGGLFGASTGPILQGMVISFPEIGPKYAGSAGGIVGTVSLLLSYILPVIISALVGQNFTLTFMVQALMVAATAIFVIILPDANRQLLKQ